MHRQKRRPSVQIVTTWSFLTKQHPAYPRWRTVIPEVTIKISCTCDYERITGSLEIHWSSQACARIDNEIGNVEMIDPVDTYSTSGRHTRVKQEHEIRRCCRKINKKIHIALHPAPALSLSERKSTNLKISPSSFEFTTVLHKDRQMCTHTTIMTVPKKRNWLNTIKSQRIKVGTIRCIIKASLMPPSRLFQSSGAITQIAFSIGAQPTYLGGRICGVWWSARLWKDL